MLAPQQISTAALIQERHLLNYFRKGVALIPERCLFEWQRLIDHLRYG